MHSPSDELPSRLAHLLPLIENGGFSLLSNAVSRQLEEHLLTLRWVGQHIDFGHIKTSTEISVSDFGIAIEQLKKTAFGGHAFALAFFSAEDSVVAGPFDLMIRNMDEIFWKTPGTRFVFGSDKRGDEWIPAFDDFAEYNGDGSLIVSR
jgi:hypothetical protein